MHGIGKVDGVLADLGVSSHQFNEAERGFSTRFEGAFDMRMDQRQQKTAFEIVNTYSEQQLHKLFEQYGEVTNAIIKNGYREYQMVAETPIRMADYTFYYPGWTVYVDNQAVPIQYQDPKFRGVITYDVPQGNHHVMLKFEPTRVRMVGYIVTSAFVLISVLFIFFLPSIQKWPGSQVGHLKKKNETS